MARCRDVASVTDSRLDRCNLLCCRGGERPGEPCDRRSQAKPSIAPLNLRLARFAFGTKTVPVNYIASSDRQLGVQTPPVPRPQLAKTFRTLGRA